MSEPMHEAGRVPIPIPLRVLVLAGERARHEEDWTALRSVALTLGPMLRERLQLLSMQVAFLIEDEMVTSAVAIWEHLHDAVHAELAHRGLHD